MLQNGWRVYTNLRSYQVLGSVTFIFSNFQSKMKINVVLMGLIALKLQNSFLCLVVSLLT